MNVTHARPLNERWAYKLSAGYYTSDAFARPTGLIPNGTGTPYPAFSNQGTSQPKFTGRVDYDDPDGKYKVVVAGGYSGTDGIIHTGIGPFDITGLGLGYGTMRYSRGALQVQLLHQHPRRATPTALLAVGTDGQPMPFAFDTQTYDFELGDVKTIGTRQVITYGGNLRRNNFDLSLAPLGNSRTEVGGYVQDEIFINDHFRWNIGVRVDKFANIDDAMVSPRTALIFKPTADHAIRASYNRAFRAPSLINNYLDTTIINQVEPRADQSGVCRPGLQLPGRTRSATRSWCRRARTRWNWPTPASSRIARRSRPRSTTRGTRTRSSSRRRRATARPIRRRGGWPRWRRCRRRRALGVLEVLPPPCASLTEPCTTGGLPSEFSYLNLGEVINKGVELGIDGAVNAALNVFANYSYQATPDPDFDISEVNLPPNNRVNLGFNFSQGRFLGNMSYTWVDDAYWQDVLDARYHGPTDAYLAGQRRVRREVGRRKFVTTLKVINLFNEDIQSHVFGDILKRQVIGELRVTF